VYYSSIFYEELRQILGNIFDILSFLRFPVKGLEERNGHFARQNEVR